MPLYDLSPIVTPETPHWPGDQDFTRAERWRIADGSSVNVGTVTTTSHIGAHIDAPAHVVDGAATAEAIPLDACIGDCLVIDVADLVDRTVTPHGPAPVAAIRARIAQLLQRTQQTAPAHPAAASAGPMAVERVLLRHRSAPGNDWLPDSPGLDPEFVTWFAGQGGRLIGIDLDSFDPLTSKELPAHHAAIAGGVVMLEGLALAAVPEGVGDLAALPVAWAGADAAPVRAVLRT